MAGDSFSATLGASSVRSCADGIYIAAEGGAVPAKIIAGVATPLGLVGPSGSLLVSAASGVEVYSRLDGTRLAMHRSVLTVPRGGVGELNGLVLGPMVACAWASRAVRPLCPRLTVIGGDRLLRSRWR